MNTIRIPPQIANDDFAGWLKNAMAERRISLRMLAIRADVDHSTISRLASGTRAPLLSTALSLIRVLEREAVPRPTTAPVARLIQGGVIPDPLT